MKQGSSSRPFPKRNDREKDTKSKMVCFNCEKPGHFASECRQKKTVAKTKVKNAEYYRAKYLQAKAKEHKSFITGEEDWAETSSEEEEDAANLCLMASSPASTSKASSSTTIEEVFDFYDSSISNEECREALSEMTLDLYKALEKAKLLKEQKNIIQEKLNSCLTELNNLKSENERLSKVEHENSNLTAIHRVLLKEQKDLKDKLEVERSTVKTWTNSSNKVHEILESQISVGQKAGIGYNTQFYNQIYEPIPEDVQLKTLQKYNDNKIKFVKAKEVKIEEGTSTSTLSSVKQPEVKQLKVKPVVKPQAVKQPQAQKVPKTKTLVNNTILLKKGKAIKTEVCVKQESPVSNTKVTGKLVESVVSTAKLKSFKAFAKKGSLVNGQICTCHTNKTTDEIHVHNFQKKEPKKKRCYECGSTSHLVAKCKQNPFYKPVTKLAWIPKGITNPPGPIMKWVPKGL